ncbi:FAD-dependent oxidoreductase [Sanguibacter sp. Z1732]|uniref:FAD-dependent oxidoreductase n=1 Tax=Sanguibacter sp. Z1732 TaxID=3435412 RepID=UPI003D9C921D
MGVPPRRHRGGSAAAQPHRPGPPNVLVAGRCFSATHDAHASIRSMAQCMAMGQAAGTAAALAATTPGLSGDVREVAPQQVRAVLRRAGAVLELDEAREVMP